MYKLLRLIHLREGHRVKLSFMMLVTVGKGQRDNSRRKEAIQKQHYVTLKMHFYYDKEHNL